MRKIDYILISGFLLLSTLLLWKNLTRDQTEKRPALPLKSGQHKNLAASPKHSLPNSVKTEEKFSVSKFENGIPQEFYPKDLSPFGSLEKLEEDLHYRKLRMYEQFDKERDAFRNLKGQEAETEIEWMHLLRIHQKATHEFDAKYEELINEFKENRQKFLQQDLR